MSFFQDTVGLLFNIPARELPLPVPGVGLFRVVFRLPALGRGTGVALLALYVAYFVYVLLRGG